MNVECSLYDPLRVETLYQPNNRHAGLNDRRVAMYDNCNMFPYWATLHKVNVVNLKAIIIN